MWNYTRLVAASICAASSIAAYALAKIIPDGAAAAYAVLAALLWGYGNDPVTKHFRTDVERILEPNDAVKIIAGGAIIIGMLAAASVAAMTGNVMLAAPIGVATVLIFAADIFK